MTAIIMNSNTFIVESSISKHRPYPSLVQSWISAKLLYKCRQRGLESKSASGVLNVLQALVYALQATPTLLAVCTPTVLAIKRQTYKLLNFGDCDDILKLKHLETR